MLGFGVWPHWALHMPLSHLSLFFSMLCSLTLDVSVPLSSSLSSSIYSFLPTSLSVFLSVCLPLCLPLCLSLCFPWSLFLFILCFPLSVCLTPFLYLIFSKSLSLSLSPLSFPLCNVNCCICFSGERYSFPHANFFLLKKKPS